MLYDTYENPKLLPFKDEAEEKQIDELVNELCSLAMRSVVNHGLLDGDRERYEIIPKAISLLHDALISRYVASFPSAEEGITQDLHELLDGITKEDIDAWIAENIASYNSASEEEKGIRMPMDYNYTAAHLYMQTAVRAQLFAIDHFGGDTASAEAHVAEAAAKIYAPKEGEKVPQMLYPSIGWPSLTQNETVSITELPQRSYISYPISKMVHSMAEVSSIPNQQWKISAGAGADITLELSDTLTTDDILVLIAISDMVDNAGDLPIRVTPSQIYKNLHALQPSDYVSEVAQQEIINSVDRLMNTKMSFDISQQIEKQTRLKMRDPEYFSTKTREGQVLAAYKDSDKKVLFRGKRLETVSYLILSLPLGVEYSKAVRQIIKIDKKLIAAPKGESVPSEKVKGKATRKNDRETAIRYYLVQNITRVKRKKGTTFRLSYDAIAKAIGIDSPTAKQRERLMKNINDVLTGFVSLSEISRFDRYLAKDGASAKERRVRGYGGVEIWL